MKIYNKKGWVLGMGEILLGIVGVHNFKCK